MYHAILCIIKLEYLRRVRSFQLLVTVPNIIIGCLLLQVLHPFGSVSKLGDLPCAACISYILPVNIMFVLMMLPILVSPMFRNTMTWKVCLMFWTTTMVTLVMSIFVLNAYKSIWALLLYTPSSLMLLCQNEFEHHEITKLVLSRDDEIFIFKGEVGLNVKESQNMVSNVAHDLKTVSTTFYFNFNCFIHDILIFLSLLFTKPLSGVFISLQNIKSNVSDCQCALNSGKPDYDFIAASLQNIQDEMKVMTVMNIFMTESINRVLDASKSQNGIKLVPQNESISISDTFSLPISCMREMQSKIKIELTPIDANICSHIVTDKQWLQENMICLLSNAVKYSSEGEVAISICKVDSKDLFANTQFEVNGNSVTAVDEIVKKNINFEFPLTPRDEMSRLNSSSKSSSKSVNRENVTHVSAKSNLFLLVKVEDNGIGIPQETMDELFSPFKQAQRLAGGTGLGLYSLAKRVDALNGHYGVRSRSDGNQGSNFWFAIPYKPDHLTARHLISHPHHDNEKRTTSKISHTQITASTLDQTFQSPSPAGLSKENRESTDSKLSEQSSDDTNKNRFYSSQSVIEKSNISDEGHKLNILLVDDSFSILKVVGKMLCKHGHCVTEASNGEEALRMLNKARTENDMKPFDVVIIDLQMPVMDGKCTLK